MFRECISTTPLTNHAANVTFEKSVPTIYGTQDITFTATLRALLANRIKDGIVEQTFSVADISPRHYDGATSFLDNICKFKFVPNRNNTLQIISIIASREEEAFNFIENSFCEAFPSYTKLEKISLFYKKQFRALCFIDANLESTVIFASNIGYDKLHYLQCSIPAFLPWFFPAPTTITEDEMALLKSLRERSSDKYLEAIGKISTTIDTRSCFIHSSLFDFETRRLTERASLIEKRIRDYRENIEELLERISVLNDRIEEENYRIAGVRATIEKSEAGEVEDFFLHNKNLYLERVRDDGSLEIVVMTKLVYFDPDIIKTYISSRASMVFHPEHITAIADESGLEMLLNALFIEKTLCMHVCAAYLISPHNARGLQDYDFGAVCGNTHFPNPHINSYSCLGDYRKDAIECLEEGDYISALNIMQASAASMNYADTPVYNEFFRQFHRKKDEPFIELPDGRIVSPNDAIKYLKGECEDE